MAFPVLPFFVLVDEDGADEPGHGWSVGEDLDDVGAAFDLGLETFDGVVGPDLVPVFARHGRERGQVGFGIVEHRGNLGERARQCCGDLVVCRGDRFRGFLGEHCRDERVDWFGVLRPEWLGDVAGEMNPAALTRGPSRGG